MKLYDESLLLGLDLGTTLIKAVIFTPDGEVVSSSDREVQVEYPRPGWAEQDPEALWLTTVQVIRGALEKIGVDGSRIAGVSLTGQMHGTFLIDDEGRPVRRRAIIWLDTRSKDLVNRLYEMNLVDRIYDISGWKLIPSMQLSHLCWLRDHEAETLRKARIFLTCKDYIRYKLTGIPLTDFTDASVTGLMDIRRGAWSDEILELMKLPREILPEIRGSWEYAGSITEEASRLTGLKAGTPVAVGAGDICSTALGTGAIHSGQLTAIIGTAGIYELTVNELVLDEERRYSVAYHAAPGLWLLEAVQMVAGAALRWFRDEFCGEERMEAEKMGVSAYALLDEEARQSPLGSNGIIFHPFLQGERSPFVNPDARGMFFGIGLWTKKRDFIRAVLEGVSFAAKDNIELFRRKNLTIREVRMTGGGAKSDLWPQIMADVLGLKIAIPKVKDSGALGAAIHAGLVSGNFRNLSEGVERMVRLEKVYEPDLSKTEKYEKIFTIYRKLYEKLWEIYKEASLVYSSL